MSLILESKNLNLYQRGEMVNKYIDFMNYPVGCVKNINIDKILNIIKKNLKD